MGAGSSLETEMRRGRPGTSAHWLMLSFVDWMFGPLDAVCCPLHGHASNWGVGEGVGRRERKVCPESRN